MLEKIKSIFRVFFKGAIQSFPGFIGAAMVVLSVYFVIGLFTGTANIQNLVRNRIALSKADGKIAAAEEQLDRVNLHIKLLQEHSKDFISEMALKHLNLGDPNLLIIKK